MFSDPLFQIFFYLSLSTAQAMFGRTTAVATAVAVMAVTMTMAVATVMVTVAVMMMMSMLTMMYFVCGRFLLRLSRRCRVLVNKLFILFHVPIPLFV